MLALSFLALGVVGAAAACKLIRGPERAVVRVLGGDRVLLDDGSTLRLVNILAPRRPLAAGPDDPWPPADAARKALTALVAGRSVRLSFAGLRRDRYGRRLAHLHVVPQDGGAPVWVQRRLVASGHARVTSFADNRACVLDLLAAEREARRKGLGLWRHAAYRIRRASRPRALLAFRNSFQIVEGRVRAVGTARGRTYLNFGPHWREDFTIVIGRRGFGRFTRAGFDLTGLRNKRVRVRGWLIERNGPAIRATHPEQIERLSRARRRPSQHRHAPSAAVSATPISMSVRMISPRKDRDPLASSRVLPPSETRMTGGNL